MCVWGDQTEQHSKAILFTSTSGVSDAYKAAVKLLSKSPRLRFLTSAPEGRRRRKSVLVDAPFGAAQTHAARVPFGSAAEALQFTCAVFSSNHITRVEEALQQNETINVFGEDFATLGTEEFVTTQANGEGLKETMNFTDLTYSKAKLITCIQWVPE